MIKCIGSKGKCPFGPYFSDENDTISESIKIQQQMAFEIICFEKTKVFC